MEGGQREELKTRILNIQRERKIVNEESGVVELLSEHQSKSEVHKEKLLRLLKKDKEENGEPSSKTHKRAKL